jgi:hypothetical protein
MRSSRCPVGYSPERAAEAPNLLPTYSCRIWVNQQRQSSLSSCAIQIHAMTCLLLLWRRSGVCSSDGSRPGNDLPLLVETSLLSVLPVTLCQPSARLDQLHNIHPLLERHDGQADNANHPWNSAIHFVGASHFHRSGGERRGEESGSFGCGGRAWKESERFAAVNGQEGGSDGRRGEAEEV